MGRIMQDIGSNYVTFNSNCRIAKATGVYNKEAPSEQSNKLKFKTIKEPIY
jgi:hypothetical protein